MKNRLKIEFVRYVFLQVFLVMSATESKLDSTKSKTIYSQNIQKIKYKYLGTFVLV